MIIEKISMVDALNMETKELMNGYQQMLENMSKEELISEIGKLLVDKGILLDGRDNQINELKEEIERLMEEKKTLVWLNQSLKKQEDELKEQRDVFKRLFESANTTHFSTDSIIETMNSFYREQADHLAGLKIEQAVKYAVKEILDKAIIIDKNTGNNGFICIEALTELCKSKGVEVE